MWQAGVPINLQRRAWVWLYFTKLQIKSNGSSFFKLGSCVPQFCWNHGDTSFLPFIAILSSGKRKGWMVLNLVRREGVDWQSFFSQKSTYSQRRVVIAEHRFDGNVIHVTDYLSKCSKVTHMKFLTCFMDSCCSVFEDKSLHLIHIFIWFPCYWTA